MQTVPEKIKQRRSQMLIHSYLYYHMDTSIVSDHQWQDWANELAYLQSVNTRPIGFYDKEFIGWDGSSGYHLPKDDWIHSKAVLLLQSKGK